VALCNPIDFNRRFGVTDHGVTFLQGHHGENLKSKILFSGLLNDDRQFCDVRALDNGGTFISVVGL
jgi:hypothetical protein